MRDRPLGSPSRSSSASSQYSSKWCTKRKTFYSFASELIGGDVYACCDLEAVNGCYRGPVWIQLEEQIIIPNMELVDI